MIVKPGPAGLKKPLLNIISMNAMQGWNHDLYVDRKAAGELAEILKTFADSGAQPNGAVSIKDNGPHFDG